MSEETPKRTVRILQVRSMQGILRNGQPGPITSIIYEVDGQPREPIIIEGRSRDDFNNVEIRRLIEEQEKDRKALEGTFEL